MLKGLLLAALSLIYLVNSHPSSFFSQQNQDSAVKSLQSLQKSDGFGSLRDTYFAVMALDGLSSSSSISKKDSICDAVRGKGTNAETVFYESAVYQSLNCGQPSSSSGPIIESTLKSSKPIDLAYSLLSLHYLALHKYNGLVRQDDVNAAIKSLISKADDEGLFANSIFTTGLALQALSNYGLATDKSLSELLTNAALLIDQAEGDNHHEFSSESGASSVRVTSEYFSGIVALAKLFNKKDVLKAEDVSKLAETFIQHKHASNPEDIYAVVKGLNAAKNSVPSPLVFTLSRSSLSSVAKGDDAAIRAHVTDVFGKFASKSKVTLSKASDKAKKALVSGLDLAAAAGDNTAYALDFLSHKPDQGLYNLDFKVVPENSAYAAIQSIIHPFRVISQISLVDLSIVVSETTDPKDIKAGKEYKAEYPNAVSTKIKAEPFQFITVTFKLKNAAGKIVQPHQVFAHLGNADSEVVVAATTDNKQFVATLNLDELSSQLRGKSNEYNLVLTIGDAYVSNSFSYNVAKVQVNYAARDSSLSSHFAAKPEIVHRFRPDEKRPSASISRLFTLAVLSPIAFLLIGLARVGANLKNFPTGSGFVYAVGFQGCLGAILLLFVYYWFRLNMVQALTYLAMLAVPTVFFAQRSLNELAASSKTKTA